MKIVCPSCGNHKKFLIPLWVRTTFRYNEDGTISILHVKPLESLEEKLTNHGKTEFSLTCKNCGADAHINFNEYEQLETEAAERQALERIG